MLVGLAVASLLGLALVETVLIHHRQMQAVDGRQQCFWLAEAGLQRAQRRVAEDSDYQGEEWTVPADALGGDGPAVVTIVVEKESAESPAGKIRVEARFPAEGLRRSVCRRELALPSEL